MFTALSVSYPLGVAVLRRTVLFRGNLLSLRLLQSFVLCAPLLMWYVPLPFVTWVAATAVWALLSVDSSAYGSSSRGAQRRGDRDLFHSSASVVGAALLIASLLFSFSCPAAAWYSALWILPALIVLTVSSCAPRLTQALATTMYAHALGTLGFCAAGMPAASFWAQLFPIVCYERAVLVVALLVVDAVVSAVVRSRAFSATA